MNEVAATVWDNEQVLCESPDSAVAVKLWAAVGRRLIGETTPATVSIDCDDGETEARLRVAGFKVAEVDQPDGVEVVDSVTLELQGPLANALAAVLRLPPEAPLGALAIADGRGVDLDLGVGMDVWGPGALASLRAAAAELGLAVRERPPED